MPRPGGFVVPHSWVSPEPKSVSPPPDHLLLDLTPKQNARLTAWLDEHLLNLERDFKKRAFKDAHNLVSKVDPVLTVILQTPPSPAYASQRIAYMLSISSAIPRYITTLAYKSDTARELLAMLSKFDRGWSCILKGEIWINDHKTAKYQGLPGRMDTTEQTRLRSIILIGRQQLEDWSYREGEGDKIETDTLSFGNEALQLMAELQDEDEDDLDMVDV